MCIRDRGVTEYLESWWKKEGSHYSNRSPKLEGYYARKKVHVMKIAMAEHFSESLDKTIPLERFVDAIEILKEEECRMHLAIVLTGPNVISVVSTEVIKQLTNNPEGLMFIDLLMNCHHVATKEQLIEAMDFLQETKQITSETKQDMTGDNV